MSRSAAGQLGNLVRPANSAQSPTVEYRKRRERWREGIGASFLFCFSCSEAVPFLMRRWTPISLLSIILFRRTPMMVMLLSDFQAARSTNDFFTGMSMVQYGLTDRWTVGFMAEGQKIFGLPTTYGGLRVNSYFRVFPRDRLLNFTLYGEYEGLNGAG